MFQVMPSPSTSLPVNVPVRLEYVSAAAVSASDPVTAPDVNVGASLTDVMLVPSATPAAETADVLPSLVVSKVLRVEPDVKVSPPELSTACTVRLPGVP